MRLGASTSDWHTNNPRLRPGLWILALLAGAAVIFVLVGTVGRFVGGACRTAAAAGVSVAVLASVSVALTDSRSRAIRLAPPVDAPNGAPQPAPERRG